MINFFVLDGLTLVKIHPKSLKFCKDASPSFSIVKNVLFLLKSGSNFLMLVQQFSSKNDPRGSYPKTVTPPRIIPKVHSMLLYGL